MTPLKIWRRSDLCLISIFLVLAAMMWSGVSVQDKTGNIASSLNDTPKKWAITFSESPSSLSDSIVVGNLDFIQIDNDIFGYGNLTSNKKTLRVAVAGSFNSNVLNLYLVTPRGDMMHKLSMSMKGKSLSGDYANYTSSSIKRTGAISGRAIEESIIKKDDKKSGWIECGVGLGLTPSKELAEKPTDGKDMENLITELNSGVPDSGRTNENSS